VIKFLPESGELQYAWTTSWGMTTRLIGALLMTHSDDDGLVLPPRLAPTHVVILPITAKAENPAAVIDYCRKLANDLRALRYHERNVEVEVDERDLRGGEKTWSWVKKGVPIRLEIGPRDMAQNAVFMARRDLAPNEKQTVARDAFVSGVTGILDEIQTKLLERAKAMRASRMREIDSKEDFYAYFAEGSKEPRGFALTHWAGDSALEKKLKEDLKVTLRCIPLEGGTPGTCPFTGKPSKQRVIFAESY
jgi:prolyl-tRNA synthetase